MGDLRPPPHASLDDQYITRWVGVEMALEGGNATVTDDTIVTGWAGISPIVWTRKDVPFLQFSVIDIETATGGIYRLSAEFDHGDGREYGLLLSKTEELLATTPADPDQFFRTRVLEELPIGTVKVDLVQDSTGGIVELTLKIGGDIVRLLSGEIHTHLDGGFNLVSPDESILVQVNGARPSLDGARRGVV